MKSKVAVLVSLCVSAVLLVGFVVAVDLSSDSKVCMCGSQNEPVTSIGSLKRHIEVYHIERGEYAPDTATLEEDGYITPGSFHGQDYNRYTWRGEVIDKRFVGSIIAHPREKSDAPIFAIRWEPDGRASISRSGGSTDFNREARNAKWYEFWK